MNPSILRKPPALLLLVVLVAALGACGTEPASGEVVGGLPEGTLVISNGDSLTLQVQLALTPSAQARGLMGVEEIPQDYGMVFLWSEPGVHAFHMKDTLIPLDIAFWDTGGRIVDIQTMEPCRQANCPIYTPSGEHIAAVEVRGGLLESNGVKVGDRVELTET
ncbi:MAG TPA: DUF192 domain-containing protein [Actinomycetota bacterium]|nr:DUF192 domain-containing protein [Actinomycetota bacterium]